MANFTKSPADTAAGSDSVVATRTALRTRADTAGGVDATTAARRSRVVVAPSPIPLGTSALGCGVNTAAIFDRGGVVRILPIDRTTFIQYGRIKDDMSDALIRVPISATCCSGLGDIEPVRHELVIFRDGRRVWEGPITRMAFSATEVEIAARDVLFWAYRTIMRSAWDNSYPNIGYGTDRIGNVLRGELARKELGAYPINVLPFLQIHTQTDTARTSRNTVPYQKTVFEEMDDMASKSGVDYTAVGRAIHVQDTGYALGVTPLVTSQDFLAGIIVTSYGMDLATVAGVTDGEGMVGFATADSTYYGEVEILATAYDEENDTSDPTESELRSQAHRNLSQRYPVPLVVRVPDNSQIDPASQALSFDMLVPGVKVPLMATAGCKTVRQDQKIDRVDVKQDEDGEVVTLSLVTFPGQVPEQRQDATQ